MNIDLKTETQFKNATSKTTFISVEICFKKFARNSKVSAKLGMEISIAKIPLHSMYILSFKVEELISYIHLVSKTQGLPKTRPKRPNLKKI